MQLNRRVANSDVTLFGPGPVYRTHYPSYDFNEDNAGAAEVPAAENPTFPEYPQPGANIDYYLADGAQQVELKIYQGRRLIRSFTNRPLTEFTALQTAGTPQLPTDAGMHRVRWDLRTYGAWSEQLSRRGTGGPLVTPGKYRVQLFVDGRRQATDLVVRIDPRVKAAGITERDLTGQYRLNVRIRDALTQSRQAAARIETALDNLKGQTGEPADASRRQLQRLQQQLVTDQSISYPERKLIDQISYLYNMTTAADQALGRDAFVRYGQVRKQLDNVQTQLNQILRRCGDRCR